MSIRTRVGLCAVLSVGICVAMSSVATADFLNPGFEVPDAGNASLPADWVTFAGFGGAVERNGDSPRTGSFDLMMMTDSDTGGFAGAYQEFSVSPGDEIEFSAWGRVDDMADGTPGVDDDGDPTTQMRMRFEWRAGGNGSGDPNTQINITGSINDTYQLFTVNDVAPAGVDAVRAVFALNRNNDKFYFDDASFSVVPEPTSLGLILFAGIGLLCGRRRR